MEKPQPILAHMPRHIKKQIVDSLHTVHKLSLRQCSKEFKSIVDQSTITYKNLVLEWNQPESCVAIRRVTDPVKTDQMKMEGEEKEVEFYPCPNGFLKKNVNDNSEVFVENGDFVGAAVEQFVKILRNPKVFIRTLSIFLEDGYGNDELYDERRELIMDKLNESLGLLGHRVAVHNLTISTDVNSTHILRVLPHLQPGTLKYLFINPIRLSENLPVIDLNAIIGMEQFKQAASIAVSDHILTLDRETTASFARVRYHVKDFDMDELDYMVSNILRKDGWTARSISCDNFDFVAIKEYLSKFNRLGRDNWRTCGGGGSECYVEIDEFMSQIHIYHPKRVLIS